MRRISAWFALFAVTSVLASGASAVDAGRSSITATFTQMNVPVDGSFRRFSGSVVYDPAQPAAAAAQLSVDTASFDLGDEEYNAEVRKKEWFDSKTHPVATFKSTSIRALGPDRFEASGLLTLKGKTLGVKTAVSVKTEGTLRRYTGELPISRAAFALGDKEWNDVLEDQVIVRFVIAAPAS